jgi:hypothetical protein
MAKHIFTRSAFEPDMARATRVVVLTTAQSNFWSWAIDLQNWSINHGSGKFFWDLYGDGVTFLAGVEYYFTDPRLAMAFKMRWG